MTDAVEKPKHAWWIVIAAILVAAAPHAFFPTPFTLHMHAFADGFMGISVWAPAILSGFAFFFGVEFGARRSDPLPTPTATSIIVVALIALALLYAVAFENLWTDLSGKRPWDELQVALPLYAALGAVQALFWQGFLQHMILADRDRWVGVVAAAFLPLIVYLPFYVQSDVDTVGRLLIGVFGAHALTALSYGVGFSVRVAIALGAVAGALFVWFQQAVFL